MSKAKKVVTAPKAAPKSLATTRRIIDARVKTPKVAAPTVAEKKAGRAKVEKVIDAKAKVEAPKVEAKPEVKRTAYDSRKIIVLKNENPAKSGSRKYRQFEIILSSKTIGEAKEKAAKEILANGSPDVLSSNALSYATRNEYIRFE